MEIAPDILQGEVTSRHKLVEAKVDLGDIDLESPIVAILVSSW